MPTCTTISSVRTSANSKTRTVERRREFTTVEPLAIMLRQNDPEFKSTSIWAVTAMIDGEVAALYRKWFQSPIPRGRESGNPVNPLLREQFTFRPTRW